MSTKSRTRTRAALRESIAEVNKLALSEHEDLAPCELRVGMRLDIDDTGNTSSRRTVFCPQRSHSVDVATCAACARRMTTPGKVHGKQDIVTCASEKVVARKRDAAELAMRTPVGEIARRPVVCISKDASWETMEDLLLGMKNELLVVVDASSVPCGTVTAVDLLLCPREGAANGDALVFERGFHVETKGTTADEVMTPVVQTMDETTPLSFAVSVLGDEAVKAVPIIDAKGAVVGILSATDVARWMASSFGYEAARKGRRA